MRTNTSQDYNYVTILKMLLRETRLSIDIFKWASIGVPVATLFTLIGNITCIVAFSVNRRKWLKHHVYMFLMCFSDTFVLLQMFQFLFIYQGLRYITIGNFDVLYLSRIPSFCKLVVGIELIGNGCSFTLTLCLAFDRLHALYFPFKYRTRSVSYAIKVGCMINFINIVLPIFILICVEPYDIFDINNGKIKYCWINPNITPPLLYDIFSFTYSLYYKGVIPIILLFIVNSFLIHKTFNIIKNSKDIKKSIDKGEKDFKKVAKSSLKIILLSTLYIVCISPSATLKLILYTREIHPVYSDTYLHYLDQIRTAYYGYTTDVLVSALFQSF